MLQLKNNCRAGKFSVSPSNWLSPNCNYKARWRIMYWFYDDNLRQKKKVVIHGMNKYESRQDKQEATSMIIEREKVLLLSENFNYVTSTYYRESNSLISERTYFKDALLGAVALIHCEPETKKDIELKLANVIKAIDKLQWSYMAICEVKKKHMRLILEECGTIVKIWSANNYNSYRKYLSLLFTQLNDLDAVEFNPIAGIRKQKIIKKIRTELTMAERVKLNETLKTKYYRFWLFLQIFFHSGSRISELMRLKGKDVQLPLQEFKRVIKKGRYHNEVITPIKDIALQYWIEALAGCDPDQYIFSNDLRPGDKPIRKDQITKRWYRLVKINMGITADFYSLKHTNLDETAAALNISEAQRMAGHTTPVITLDYAQGEKKRQDDRLKKVSNSFA